MVAIGGNLIPPAPPPIGGPPPAGPGGPPPPPPLLGDLGCEIIKVESPLLERGAGRGPRRSGYGGRTNALNRNKRSLTLNIDTEPGRQIFLRLVSEADVLIDNFRPATRLRLGLSYETLSRENPRLVHCSVSGFGQTGPYKDRPGFDTLAQALSGILSLVTDLDSPEVVGVSIVDHSTGIFAAYAVLAALMARERTGRGQFVDVSLLRSSLSFVESHIVDAINDGPPPVRDNFARGRIFCFVAKDGLPIAIHLSGHEKSWQGLVKSVDREDLLPELGDRKARWERHWEIQGILQQEIAKQPRSHWLPILEENGVPNAPAYTPDEVFADPHVAAMGIPVTVSHPTEGDSRIVGSPVQLSDTPTAVHRPAPLTGEHTSEILATLGYGPDDIEELRAQHVI
ncbi:MAG: CoA transferase [Chloroflexota bacterium]|nr:CoA transferase [Chloroflexota bacterium]